MIGFTTTRAAVPEPPPDVNLEELLFK